MAAVKCGCATRGDPLPGPSTGQHAARKRSHSGPPHTVQLPVPRSSVPTGAHLGLSTGSTSTGFTYLADGVFITDSGTPCSPESLLTRKDNMLILIEEKWSCHLNSICFLIMLYIHVLHTCFPGGSAGKESACNAGDQGSIPELGRSPGEGNGNPLQYSCLENSMDKGASWV